MRKYWIDPWLWALVSGSLFFPIVGAWLFEAWTRGFHRPFVQDDVRWLAISVAVGWAAQAVACRPRPTGRRVEQAEDYDDRPGGA